MITFMGLIANVIFYMPFLDSLLECAQW